MSPYETAREVYVKEPCARTFDEDLATHLRAGFVFSTPDYFIMGRAVWSKAPAHLILDPRNPFVREVCDCWMIYLAAGDMTKAWEIMPWPLPLFSFERRNELRFYKAADMKRLSLGQL